MKFLWIDDVRPAPKGWIHLKTVEAAIDFISNHDDIAVISIDHDAGDYFQYGGDYIEVLNYMEREDYDIPIHIHSMNPYGAQRMRKICEKNGWKIV